MAHHPHACTQGCWFYLAPGSGVFINVSRTRIFPTREQLRAEWYGKLLHRGSESNDARMCTAAIAHGYQSLQLLARWTNGNASAPRPRVWDAWPELAYCAGACAREESRSACPGVPLVRADGSPCTCDPSWPMLRCLEDVAGAELQAPHTGGRLAEATPRAMVRRHMRADPCPGRGTAAASIGTSEVAKSAPSAAMGGVTQHPQAWTIYSNNARI